MLESEGNASICVLIAWAISGTKVMALRSRSSHNTSANISGVMSCSANENEALYSHFPFTLCARILEFLVMQSAELRSSNLLMGEQRQPTH